MSTSRQNADREPTAGPTTVSIVAPRDRHDALVRERVAPLVRELSALPLVDAVYFERVNKPAWGLRIRVLLGDPRLDGEARALARQRLLGMTEPFAFVEDAAEDKWVGGPIEEPILKRIHHLDSLAGLDLLDVEAREGLATSRAQWSLLLVERLLDLFGIHGGERLDFYRRGFEWAPAAGRWDGKVFAALEQKFEAQAEGLRAAIAESADRDHPDAWGGATARHVALRFLEAAREPIGDIVTAASTPSFDRPLVAWAQFVAHAHSNRLGIHATREATLRYLVFRARGGEGPRAS